MSGHPIDLKFELSKIVAAVKGATTKWHDLGLHLELSEDTLGIIASDNKGDAEGCLRTMLSKWLHNDTEASWEKLAKALGAMGEYVIAANIRRNLLTTSVATLREPAEISNDDKTCMLLALIPCIDCTSIDKIKFLSAMFTLTIMLQV